MMTPQGNGMEEIRRIAEQNRTDIEVLKVQHQAMTRSLEEKHTQNRKDMHGWRGEMQASLDKYYLEIKEIGKTLLAMGEKMHSMQLTSARAKGYWLGMGAAFAVGVQLLALWVEYLVKR